MLFAPGVPAFWARGESSLFKSWFRVPHIAGTCRAVFGNWGPKPQGGTYKRILSSVLPGRESCGFTLSPQKQLLAFIYRLWASGFLLVTVSILVDCGPFCCEVFAKRSVRDFQSVDGSHSLDSFLQHRNSLFGHRFLYSSQMDPQWAPSASMIASQVISYCRGFNNCLYYFGGS